MSRDNAAGESKRMNRGARRMHCAIVVAAALTLPGASALASTSELDMAGIQPVDDVQLSTMRGGFSMGGMSISFGVIMETVINGATHLLTSFNLENAMNPHVEFNGNSTPAFGVADAQGFVLQQAANGGFVMTNGIGTTTLQQMGNAGGGIVSQIANSLNDQKIQQNTSVNIAIQNVHTIMGLSAIGMLMDRFGPNLLR
jgi:hypothetical protein